MFKTGIALFTLIMCVTMNDTFISSAFAASPPVPAFDMATVDGDTSEWNLTEDGSSDFSAHARRKGHCQKPNLFTDAKLSLCSGCSDDPDEDVPDDEH